MIFLSLLASTIVSTFVTDRHFARGNLLSNCRCRIVLRKESTSITETDLWECRQTISHYRYRSSLEIQFVSMTDADFGLETNEFCNNFGCNGKTLPSKTDVTLKSLQSQHIHGKACPSPKSLHHQWFLLTSILCNGRARGLITWIWCHHIENHSPPIFCAEWLSPSIASKRKAFKAQLLDNHKGLPWEL